MATNILGRAVSTAQLAIEGNEMVMRQVINVNFLINFDTSQLLRDWKCLRTTWRV